MPKFKQTLKNGSLESAELFPDKLGRFRNNNVGPSFDPRWDEVENPMTKISDLFWRSEVLDPAFDQAVCDRHRKQVKQDRMNPELENDKTSGNLKWKFSPITFEQTKKKLLNNIKIGYKVKQLNH